MLKCAPGVWRKREIYLIIEKSLIVFEKNNIMLKMWRLAPGYLHALLALTTNCLTNVLLHHFLN